MGQRADSGSEMATTRTALLFVAALVTALALALPSGATAGLRSCGGGIRVAIVSCPKAKRIAKEYAKTQAHSLQGYACSGGGSQGRCVLDRKVVLFPL